MVKHVNPLPVELINSYIVELHCSYTELSIESLLVVNLLSYGERSLEIRSRVLKENICNNTKFLIPCMFIN